MSKHIFSAICELNSYMLLLKSFLYPHSPLHYIPSLCLKHEKHACIHIHLFIINHTNSNTWQNQPKSEYKLSTPKGISLFIQTEGLLIFWNLTPKTLIWLLPWNHFLVLNIPIFSHIHYTPICIITISDSWGFTVVAVNNLCTSWFIVLSILAMSMTNDE